jgi:hypothetical protein
MEIAKEPETDKKGDAAILSEADSRFEQIKADDSHNRTSYISDIDFVFKPGAQWAPNIRAQRKTFGEEVFEFNQVKQFVSQVVNDQLQNRPGIRIHPANGEASEKVAEIMQGLVRQIENDSKADNVYKNGFRLAVAGNRGWWRVVSEYDSEDGFNQRLAIKPILDTNSVYASLDYDQPDGSDREYAFVVQRFSKTEFLSKWPNADAVNWEQISPMWSDGADSIYVADYYRRVCTKRKKVLLSDGIEAWKDEVPALPEGVTITREREVDTYKVEWYTIGGGLQILEKHKWPGTVIPVVQCVGDDIYLDGKRTYQSLTCHARDAQSMFNFGMTQQAIHLALTPRAPWVIAEGQIGPYQDMWKNANTKSYGALIYKPTSIDGIIVPPPQRTQPSIVSEGWDRWCQTMTGLIKSTIGMYENSLGQRSQETSGRAIIAREKQGDTATYNYVHNWHMAIELTGRIVAECIPTFYDAPRIISIIGPDDTKRLVQVNQATPDPDNPLQAIADNDLTKGKYGVTIEAGPSFATKRQETSEALMSFVQAFPQAAQVAGDLIVKSLDVADADIIADRLKLTMPPQILEAENAKKEGREPPDPAMMAAMQEKDQQLQQAMQTMQAMHEKVQELESGVTYKLKTLEAENNLKRQAFIDDQALETIKAEQTAETTLRKAQIDANAKIEAAKINAQVDLMIAGMKGEKEEPKEPEEQGPDVMQALLLMQQQTNEVLGMVANGLDKLGKPRRRVLEKGPDGRAIGAIELIED